MIGISTELGEQWRDSVELYRIAHFCICIAWRSTRLYRIRIIYAVCWHEHASLGNGDLFPPILSGCVLGLLAM